MRGLCQLATRQQVGFALRFAACMALVIAAFSRWEPVFGSVFLRPATLTAAAALELIGVPNATDCSAVAQGYCALITADGIYYVEHECTGVFTLLVLLSAMAAYPAAASRKVLGVLVGVAAFFAYSALRIAVLILVGHLLPGLLDFVHLYLMVLLNLGFLVFLLALWVNRWPLRQLRAGP